MNTRSRDFTLTKSREGSAPFALSPARIRLAAISHLLNSFSLLDVGCWMLDIRLCRYPIRMLTAHRPHPFLLATLFLLPPTALIEFSMHRLPISQSHHIQLWASVTSPELSQQIADAYSFSHIIHGLAFYFLFRIGSRRKFSLPLCFF